MSSLAESVLVVGAGVSGLTTAICLAEAGRGVRVWTAEPPQRTTSVVAGALWGPSFQEPMAKTTGLDRGLTEGVHEARRRSGHWCTARARGCRRSPADRRRAAAAGSDDP